MKPAAWSLRQWDAAAPGLGRWQRRRIQHQEFETSTTGDDHRSAKFVWRRRPALSNNKRCKRKSRSMKDGWRVADMRWRKIENVLARLTR
ncbi:Primosomal replication protein N prime prime [Salmonella enterica subsp. enterica]|uniref:Primosomal replication protein N prime prime n=1 Tax=Salmonella enterica I TaxID=59201 RepID=A0A3S4IWX3_SALET|nr:Primosomal replication protein N prime prime [Salmonella enterica subsp. enterica]